MEGSETLLFVSGIESSNVAFVSAIGDGYPMNEGISIDCEFMSPCCVTA
ncbi:hypothetical protein IMSAG025_02027 [Muribaculaceae bacterium]|nr:hypothetical protein IMSAG025_02027 [Muribaculaceae bacterium]